MAEESGGPNTNERLWMLQKKEIELPTPLDEANRPSRAELAKYTPVSELFLKPDLPQHGIYHGASVLVWSNVLFNMAPKNVQNQMDKTALNIASLYHDCGRQTDYGYLTGEMKKHGPRGADIIREHWQAVDPNLTDESN